MCICCFRFCGRIAHAWDSQNIREPTWPFTGIQLGLKAKQIKMIYNAMRWGCQTPPKAPSGGPRGKRASQMDIEMVASNSDSNSNSNSNLNWKSSSIIVLVLVLVLVSFWFWVGVWFWFWFGFPDYLGSQAKSLC